MRIKLFLATAATAAAVLSVAACSSNDTDSAASSANAPMSASMSMTAPMSGMMTHTGTFSGLNGKKAAGTATVEGSTVTLSGYSSDEGPDLHLYLAKGTSEDDVASGVQLGKVAHDQASQSFTVPASAKAGDYTYVVVHCDKARAVFGAAELK